ncbi:MAG TPA: carboxypeptidase-like regulatory domain-containing protein, partial [Longimicrobiaceae bacterium]|nr:carboxypeptidase-like regulatory domain-containing protein [Longimicrobiaceae bacterium]
MHLCLYRRVPNRLFSHCRQANVLAWRITIRSPAGSRHARAQDVRDIGALPSPRGPVPRSLTLRALGARAAAALFAVFFATGAASPPGAEAQGAGGDRQVTGRVVDDRGAPLAGVAVTITSSTTGAVGSSVTDAEGGYSVAAAGGDRHELRARRIGFYALAVEVVFPPGALRVERELRLTPTAVEMEPLEVRSVRAVRRPPAPRTPGGQDMAQNVGVLSNLPLQPGDLNDIAALKAGVYTLGGDQGLVMGGQAPSQSSTTLDGASYGATSLPAEALASAAVVTNTFDPARGQFSGGQVAATTLSGTDLFGGAARFRFSDPTLQTATPAQEDGLLAFSGGAGGALVP